MAPVPSWYTHADLLSVLIGCLCLIVCWFIVKTLARVDSNQTKMFTWLENLSRDFYLLKGSHDAIRHDCGSSPQKRKEED